MCAGYEHEIPRLDYTALFPFVEEVEPWDDPPSLVRPTDLSPVVFRASSDSRVTVGAMRWGLVPSWSRDPSSQRSTFNARAETVAEKPTFRAAFARRRCLIAMRAYVEWRREGRRSVPMRVSSPDGEPLVAAGLWETWQPPDGKPVMRSYTLITREPPTDLLWLHDRAPALLASDAWQDWLDGVDLQGVLARATRLGLRAEPRGEPPTPQGDLFGAT